MEEGSCGDFAAFSDACDGKIDINDVLSNLGEWVFCYQDRLLTKHCRLMCF